METFESYAKKLRKIERETILDIIAIKEENDRLKRLYETDKESWKEQMYELQARIDKATSFIEEFNRIILSRKGISKEELELMIIPYELLEILKGECYEIKESKKIT